MRQAIIDRLAEGESLSSICRDKEMPCWRTVYNWIDAEPDFAAQVTRARECGYIKRADEAILAAKSADDAAKGRLAFDAERWYLGKLSNAFSDKTKHEHSGPDGKPIETFQRIERHVIDPHSPDSHS